MERVILQTLQPQLFWLDVENPSLEELDALSKKYGIHETSVQDCLEPEHLPKFEKIGNTTFIILRAYDENSAPEEDTVQGITRKIALFFSNEFLITVHRRSLPFLNKVTEDFKPLIQKNEWLLPLLLVEIIGHVLDSYERPMEAIETRLEQLENTLFSDEHGEYVLREVYLIKHRLTVLKRMLGHTMSVIQKIHPPSHGEAPHFQDLKENAESLFFFIDELVEEANNLMTIQITLASHRTNEVVRILTLFSVVFMPLTFVVGIYGMNFKHMPELDSPNGYWIVWGVMITIAISLMAWFKRSGWLR